MSRSAQNEERKVFTLLDVSKSIQRTISERYGTAFWLKAEMNKLNYYKHSGHCYPDLVEKRDGKVLAQMRGTLWKDDYRAINQKFVETTSEPLKDGIKILMLVKIVYEPNYGLALRILDIDPSFTLGDLEREKQETIAVMKESGVFFQNKSLDFPLIPKRIAIISVETSKGYADFIKILESNPYGFRFETHLFPSLLQGDGAVEDIKQKLLIIKGLKERFDVVVIVRGGGGDVGLSCYNHLRLCEAIAQFPLPVLTGIGHATNETVAEMVANFNAITPTKLAEFLTQKFTLVFNGLERADTILKNDTLKLLQDKTATIQHMSKTVARLTKSVLLVSLSQLDNQSHSLFRVANHRVNLGKKRVNDQTWRLSNSSLKLAQDFRHKSARLSERLVENVKTISASKKLEWVQLSNAFIRLAKHKASGLETELKQLSFRLEKGCQHLLRSETVDLGRFEKELNRMDVKETLSRGFSVSRIGGKVIKSVKLAEKNSILHTEFHDGVVVSEIKEVIEHER